MSWTLSCAANRRVMLCLLLAAAAGGAWRPARAQEEPDAATKKLMAAGGLFERGLFRPAAQEYAEFLAAFPKHPQATAARYGLAVCRFRLGEPAEAAKLIDEVLKDRQFQQRDEALAVQGHCWLAAGEHQKALAALEEMLSKHADSPHAETAAINRAQALYLLGRKDACLAAAGEFARKHPNSGLRAAAEYYQALCLAGLDRHAEAAEILRGLLKKHPNCPYEPDASLLLGQCLERQGKLDDAIEQYRKVVRISADQGLYSLGVALYKAGKYADSAAELATLLAKHPDSPHVGAGRLQLAISQLVGAKVSEARKALADVVRGDPSRAAAGKYWLAQCDIAERKYDAALAGLEELSRAGPPNPAEVAFDRAVCLMELNRHADAARAFEEFRTRFAGSGQADDAAYRQAFCLHRLGQYPQSTALCEQLTRRSNSPAAAAAAELSAENLFLMGKYPEAAKALGQLVEAAKDESARLCLTFRLGQCAYLTGDFARAADVLKPLAASQKVAQDADLQEAIFLLGDCLLQTGRNPEAAETLSRFCSLAKQARPEAQYKLALAQVRKGDAASAEKTLAGLIKAPADSPWVQRGMLEYAQLLHGQKRPDPAAETLRKLLGANPPEDLYAGATYLLGWIDFDARKFDDAAGRFGELTRKLPRHALAAEAQFQQAVCLKELGRTEQAVELLEAYIKAHPDGKYATSARQMIGEGLAKLGKGSEAVRKLSALAADKKGLTDQVLYQLAWALRDTKDADAAAKTYRQLLETFPDGKYVPAARTELAELLYEGRKFSDAAGLLEKAVAAGAEAKVLSAAMYRLGWCYDKLDRPDRAAEAFAGFLEKFPDSDLAPSAMYLAGLACARQDKLPEAVKHFSGLISRHPRHEQAPMAHLKLAEVQAQAQDYDKSAETYQAYLQKFPKDKFVHLAQFGIGWSLENRKRYDDARQWYARVTDSHNGPTAARAQFQIGECWFAQGKFEQAVQELLKVDIVYAYPEWSARALYEAGRAMEQLNQPQQARAQYELCLKKHKDSPEAALAEKRLKQMGN